VDVLTNVGVSVGARGVCVGGTSVEVGEISAGALQAFRNNIIKRR
jgi:hypothetical protein